MGNSPSLEQEYRELIGGLLYSTGIEVKEKLLTRLFDHVKDKCDWFHCQQTVQLNSEAWQQVVKALRTAQQQGQTMDLKLWSLCHAITQALQLLEADSEKGGEEPNTGNRDQKELGKRVCAEVPPLHNASDEESLRQGENHQMQELIDLMKKLLGQFSAPRPTPLLSKVLSVPLPPPPPPLEILPGTYVIPRVGRAWDDDDFPLPSIFDTKKEGCPLRPPPRPEDPFPIFPVTLSGFAPNAQLPEGGQNVCSHTLRCKMVKVKPAGGTFTVAPRSASPPTWGQLKKLTQEAENVVTQTQQPRTPAALFLAMLAVVSRQSSEDGTKAE
uniref:Uncharacterized protein n=1 Tax=Molossus molossus TaxID=27622 RepID=A0A7J8I8L8_MOLMO|nr:hypothetical protein HJG59_010709 [Molossus molossus]